MMRDAGNLHIAFIHPDLGIGGAERLVVDAAVGLQKQGHEVVIYTSHCDKTHCFEEIKNGSIKVEVYGDQLPTNVGGKLFILFANLRQLYLILQLAIRGKIDTPDLYIIDQLPTCMPLLHRLSTAKLMFYCHFPDQVQSIRKSVWKKLYRVPFDLLEAFSMSAADSTVVNSFFTRSVYHRTFPSLKEEPSVIYPCVDLSSSTIRPLDEELLKTLFNTEDRFYLSINRYEKKKNILLALQAFAQSKEKDDPNAKLVIVGGYDERVKANHDYLKELENAAETLKLSYSTIFYPEFEKQQSLKGFSTSKSKVIFLASISSSLKELLLQKMELLLYTPSFEHFGIVPLEAMKNGKPVLAVNNGGPLESVESLRVGENEECATGWLREPSPAAWSAAINEYKSLSEEQKNIFKINGPNRVKKQFSRDAMTASFENEIHKIINHTKHAYFWEVLVLPLLLFISHLLLKRLLPDQSWLYLVLAVLSLGVFKSIPALIYWVYAFLS